MKRRLLLFFVLAVLWRLPAQAAVVGPAETTVSVAPGATAAVTILLDTQGESVNALQLTVTYPTELLDVVSVDQARSPFSLTVEAPAVNARLGTVTLVAGVPSGVVISNAPVLTLVVRGKTQGEGTIGVNLARSSLALADGQGTRATMTEKKVSITVHNVDPLIPVLHSDSHPDQTHWYPEHTFRVSWAQRLAFYSVMLSPSSEAVPDDVPEDLNSSTQYPNLTDGIWYFTMKERIQGQAVWSPVARYRIMVDTTAPESFAISRVRSAEHGPWLASFSAVDTLSGIARYQVTEQGPRFFWFPFFETKHTEEATLPYQLHDQQLHSSLTVEAIDQAGNRTLARLSAQSTVVVRYAWFALAAIVGLLLISIGMRRKRQRSTVLR